MTFVERGRKVYRTTHINSDNFNNTLRSGGVYIVFVYYVINYAIYVMSEGNRLLKMKI